MIPQIKNLLFPTDLSDSSNHAFSYAASIANRYDASIILLHVLKDERPTSENLVTNVIGESKWKEILDQRKTEVVEKLRSRIQRFCDEAREEMSSCPFLMEEVIIKIGNPVDEILAEIERKDYDIVIMGAHGHGAIGGAVMGSVSRRVVRRSETPVLVVRLPQK